RRRNDSSGQAAATEALLEWKHDDRSRSLAPADEFVRGGGLAKRPLGQPRPARQTIGSDPPVPRSPTLKTASRTLTLPPLRVRNSPPTPCIARPSRPSSQPASHEQMMTLPATARSRFVNR